MMKLWRNLLPLLLLSMLLSACASFYDSQVEHPALYQQPLQIEDNYSISGRFLIKQVDQNWYGNFDWQRESGNDRLDFMSPVGSTIAQIKIESGVAILTTQGKTYRGEAIDQMMQEQLGFSLPLNYLHYWIQGVPLPNYPLQSRLDSGFSQLNWQVEYLRWQDRDHPEVVQLTKGALRIKLLINW